jgi:hypothetical protein
MPCKIVSGVTKEFMPAGLYPALRDRIHAGDTDAGRDDPDALGFEDGVEGAGVLAVAVFDQVFDRDVGVMEIHDQVSGGLGGPFRGGVGSDAEDADAAAGVFDDGEDVVSHSVERSCT